MGYRFFLSVLPTETRVPAGRKGRRQRATQVLCILPVGASERTEKQPDGYQTKCNVKLATRDYISSRRERGEDAGCGARPSVHRAFTDPPDAKAHE